MLGGPPRVGPYVVCGHACCTLFCTLTQYINLVLCSLALGSAKAAYGAYRVKGMCCCCVLDEVDGTCFDLWKCVLTRKRMHTLSSNVIDVILTAVV